MTSVNIQGHEEDVINQLIESGRYASPEQAVKVSLQLLDAYESEQAKKLEQLRDDMRIPMQEYLNGECVPLDMEAIIKKAEENYASKT